METPPDHGVTPQQVRAVIDRLVAGGVVVGEADGETHAINPVAISAEEGAVLRAWVVREGASHTIEIGLGYALSALNLCEGLVANRAADARHVVIDPFQARRFANVGLQLLREAGVAPMIEHHAEPSHLALPRLLNAGRQFDLGFIDGNHRFEHVFLDLYYLGLLVRRGGIIILDDYDMPAIRRAVAFFVANRGWVIESAAPEWVVLRTPSAPDERPFDSFVEF
jgi:predicted O-methyltransferase YrrM